MSDIFEFEELFPEELHLVGTPANKFSPLVAKSNQKGKKMGKKALVKQVETLRKAVAGLAPNDGAVGSLSTVAAAHQRSFGRLGDPFAAFEDRVAAAQADLTKATAQGSDYAATIAKEELRQAKHQLTTMKMIAAESARERDPSVLARMARGQGVPLLSNRRALPDDASLRYDQ